MTKNTITILILIWFIIVWFTWWWIAQNNYNKAERIIAIDEEIAQLDAEILMHQSWYKISVEASKECEKSFLNDAQKEHVEADKKRELIEKLEKEKLGLIQNR